MARSIITVALNLQEIINNVDAQSCNRAFDPSSLLHLTKLSNLLSFDGASEIDDPNISSHTEDLKRHLAGFGLEIENVNRDGDCAFRSIVRQLLKLDPELGENKELLDHLQSLSLFTGCEESDTSTLRQLFVQELIKGENEYSGFITESTKPLKERASEFRT